ncbi:MAG: LysM peptidoglycan-binding domain-containing protein [Planctomycetota bacterium]
MKRDARIGLAVVLVLGLGVTLMVGRALYKSGSNATDFDGETIVLGDDKPSTTTSGSTMPSDASLFGNREEVRTPLLGAQPQVGAVPPAAEGFLREQTNSIEPRPPVAQPRRNESASPVGEPDDTTNAQPAPRTGMKRAETSVASTEFYAYTVTTGDSPWTISSKIYGDGKYTQKIVEANDLNSKKMKPGMTLKIPTIANKPLMLKLQPYKDAASEKKTVEVAPSKLAPASTTGDNHAAHPSTNPSTKSGSYVIGSGDTLSGIAKKHYGSNGPKTIQLIVTANHGLDPSKLKVGQEIALPSMK